MIDKNEKRAAVTDSILFQNLSNELINRLIAIAQQKKYHKGEIIFLEGWPVSGFYLVAQGQIKIFRTSPSGKEQIFHALGPGEPFGLTAIFHNTPFPACATSMVPSTVLLFPKTEFLQLTNMYPPLAMSMLAGLSRQLCKLAKKTGDLALQEVPHRLATHLVYLAEKQGRKDQISLDMPKSQLACLLGTSPENLSRIFAHMSRAGKIRVKGSTIELLCYRELEQLR